MALHLGVYALGSVDPAERRLIESHLARCPSCRADLAHLAPLPGLLARVPTELVLGGARPAAAHRGGGSPPARDRTGNRFGLSRPPAHGRPPGRTRRAVRAAAVTAAVTGAAGGFWLLTSTAGSDPLPADMTLSASNPATHIWATAALTVKAWGTSVQVTADGLPRNQVCWLVIHSRAGAEEVSAYWDDWSSGPVSVHASTPWRPSDISSVEVVTDAGVLLTISTGAAPAPPPPTPTPTPTPTPPRA